MKTETNLSYLAAFYYTAGALLILAAILSAIEHNWTLAVVWCVLGAAVFLIHKLVSKRPQNP